LSSDEKCIEENARRKKDQYCPPPHNQKMMSRFPAPRVSLLRQPIGRIQKNFSPSSAPLHTLISLPLHGVGRIWACIPADVTVPLWVLSFVVSSSSIAETKTKRRSSSSPSFSNNKVCPFSGYQGFGHLGQQHKLRTPPTHTKKTTKPKTKTAFPPCQKIESGKSEILLAHAH
jgi:hypothetical protein